VSPEAQRIAIAEACGHDQYVIIKTGYYYRPHAAGYTSSLSEAWKLPYGQAKKYEMYADSPDVPFCEKVLIRPAPPLDYLADLNACAEMEKTLTEEEQLLYVMHILGIDSGDNQSLWSLAWDSAFFCASALPERRCEAFLKAKGLWQESSPAAGGKEIL